MREKFDEQGVDGFLIGKPENIRYLCGFTGSNGTLLVSRAKTVLLTDFRYKIQARDEVKEHLGETADFEIEILKQGEPPELPTVFFELKQKKVSFEADFLPFGSYQKWAKILPEIELVPKSDLVEKLRMIKDEEEIEKIATAANIGDQAFSHILSVIKPGLSEREIAMELEFFMRKRGAEKASFDVIVASGEHSAMPHAKTTDKRLKLGELVKLDFGATYLGYNSDMTRTVVLGKANQRQKKVYNLVLEAQKRAFAETRANISGQKVDQAARDYLAREGFAEEFGHNLGHGVGLEVHELPVLGPKGGENLSGNLVEGMVFTIEPGLYFEGFGGVRIEDVVVLREKGPEILTKSLQELMEI